MWGKNHDDFRKLPRVNLLFDGYNIDKWMKYESTLRLINEYLSCK